MIYVMINYDFRYTESQRTLDLHSAESKPLKINSSTKLENKKAHKIKDTNLNKNDKSWKVEYYPDYDIVKKSKIIDKIPSVTRKKKGIHPRTLRRSKVCADDAKNQSPSKLNKKRHEQVRSKSRCCTLIL